MNEVFEKQTENIQPEPEKEQEADRSSEPLQKVISFFIGFIIVVIVGLVGFYTFSRFTQPQKETSDTVAGKPTPTPQKPTPQNVLPTPPMDWKRYSDAKYQFSIQIPKNWEAYKRAGGETTYQIGLRPESSQDVPVTISLYPNTESLSLEQWVISQVGSDISRKKGSVNGKEAIFINNERQNYVTYFILYKGNVYEISASVVNIDYYNIFEKVIASFKFTN